jgi:hypothetical protein
LASLNIDQTTNAKALDVAVDFVASFTRNLFFAMAAHEVAITA